MKQTEKPVLQKNSVLAVGLYVVLGVIALLSLKVENLHPHSWLEAHLPFFWSFFAFFSAVVIICLSKWLAKAGLEGKDASYDQPIAPAEEDTL